MAENKPTEPTVTRLEVEPCNFSAHFVCRPFRGTGDEPHLDLDITIPDCQWKHATCILSYHVVVGHSCFLAFLSHSLNTWSLKPGAYTKILDLRRCQNRMKHLSAPVTHHSSSLAAAYINLGGALPAAGHEATERFGSNLGLLGRFKTCTPGLVAVSPCHPVL